MPTKWIAPEVAFEITFDGHEIPVYRSYKDSDWERPLTFWFNTDEGECPDFEFDIRELVDRSEAEAVGREHGHHWPSPSRFAAILQKAIDEGSILVVDPTCTPVFTVKETA